MNNSRQHSAAFYAIHAALTTPVLAACFTFSPLAPHLPQAYAQTQEATSNVSNTSSVVNTNANPAIKSQQNTRNAPEPDERVASITDSDARKWSGIDGSRYGDSIRKTSRVTYTDAGKPLPVSCDVTGDNRPDMIFVDEAQQKIHVVDHIPYGSDEDDVVKRPKTPSQHDDTDSNHNGPNHNGTTNSSNHQSAVKHKHMRTTPQTSDPSTSLNLMGALLGVFTLASGIAVARAHKKHMR